MLAVLAALVGLLLLILIVIAGVGWGWFHWQSVAIGAIMAALCIAVNAMRPTDVT